MKAFHAALAGVLLCAVCHAQLTAPSAQSVPSSPGQQRLEMAKRQLLSNPRRAQSLNDLGSAYLRLARETANPEYHSDAEQALAKGLAIDPADFQLQKTHIALMLARRQYPQAKANAKILNTRTPDDVMTYGYLAEADMALGDYDDAEKSIQWMINMLPNNVPGLLLGARLRTIYGDPEGALEFLNLAFTETAPSEVEELAWIANQIASVQIESGKSDAAEQTLARAEQLFPHYIYTRENLARVRLAQHRAADAVALLESATRVDRNAHILFELAEAESAAGQSAKAAATYAAFRTQIGSQPDPYEDGSRDLILLDAQKPATAPEALVLAEREIKARHDVETLDAYAWALYVNGKLQDADVAIQKALAVGVQSAQIFNHAGSIAQKLNRPSDAAKYFELSVRTAPSSESAADSHRASGIAQPAMAVAPGDQVGQRAATLEPVSTAVAQEASASVALPTAVSSAAAPVPAVLLTPHPTDTDRVIRHAQAQVARNQKDAGAYAALGAAYLQRARETGDVSDYQSAEQSLTKSLDLDSGDFAAAAPLRTLAEVCMGEHRFDDALTYSQKALALGSGDLSAYAIIGDAHADKGEYDQAALDYARLARSATAPTGSAYARDSRLAYLKFVAGDTAGAVRLMKAAIAEAGDAQLAGENLAWLYYELGEFSTQAGDASSASAAYVAALNIHPGDYRALAGLAKLRGNQGKYAEAILLYQRAIAIVPMPIFVGELGDLYQKTGKEVDAKKQYQLVEYIGLLGHINQVLHNRDLAIFYADHDIKLAEALQLAQKEFEVRHDVYTWDALAWALYKNGRYEEAGKASEKALKFGTRDALLLYHAGMIAERLGQPDRAQKELKEALLINPRFHVIYADAAQEQLAMLATQASSKAGAEKYAH